MSTQLQDRLAAALKARADQVGPHDLRPADPPAEWGRQWGRPATYAALAAAGIAAAIVLPLAFGGGDDNRPQPTNPSPTVPAPTTTPGGHLPRSGFDIDIDGDGHIDKVQLGATGGVKVFLAVDPSHPLAKRFGVDTFVTGAADIGTPGRALVLATADNGDLTTLFNTVWTVEQGKLVRIPTQDDAVLMSGEFDRAFVHDGTLMTSSWDGNSASRGTIRVPTQSWRISNGVLTPTAVGSWCTDPSNIDVMPQPCQPGETASLGSKAGLPRIYPSLQGAFVTDGLTMDLQGGGTLGIQGNELVAKTPSGTARIPLAHHGLPAALSVVPLDHLTPPVYLVSQETGDAQLWSAYRLGAGPTLTAIAADKGLDLTDGPTPTGEQHSWQSATGAMVTAVTTDPQDTTHFELYRWTVEGDRLLAVKLGPVCLDLTNEDYGNCRG